MKGTKQTIGLIVSVFIVQMFSIRFLGATTLDFYTLEHPVIESEPWTTVLNVYSHAGFGHLLSNLVGLLIFGLIVERVTSAFRFHAFFILTGTIAALSEITFWMLLGSGTVSVLGASGAVFALMGYALFGNDLTETFIDWLDLGTKGTIILLIGVATVITLYTGSAGVALIAHATGFVLGGISGFYKILHTKNR